MNDNYRLESLSIRYNDYGEYKGRHTGKITFQNNQSEGFMFNLSPEETNEFIKMLEPKLVASASALGQKLLSSLAMLPAPAPPMQEFISHEPVTH